MNLPHPTIDKLFSTVFVIGWMGDAICTMIFISLLGLDAEANPFMRYIIQHYGFFGLWYAKIATGAFWLYTWQQFKASPSKTLPGRVVACSVFYSLPILSAYLTIQGIRLCLIA